MTPICKTGINLLLLSLLVGVLSPAGIAQTLPEVFIDAPRVGSRIPAGTNLEVVVRVSSTVTLKLVVGTFDTNGDGILSDGDEVINLQPSSADQKSFSFIFPNIQEGSVNTSRLVQIAAFDDSDEMGFKASSIFVGNAGSTLITPPPFGSSTVFQQQIGLAEITSMNISYPDNLIFLGDQYGAGTLQHFDPADRFQYLIHHTGEIRDADLSNSGQYVLTGSADGQAILTDLDQDSVIQLFNHVLDGQAYEVEAVALSADNNRVLSGAHSAGAPNPDLAWWWDASTGDSLFTLSGHSGTIVATDIAPANDYGLTAARDGDILIWDLQTAGLHQTLGAVGSGVESARYITNGTEVMAGYEDGQAMVWNVTSGAPSHFVDSLISKAHAAPVTALAVSVLNQYATADQAGIVKVWDTNDTLLHVVDGLTSETILGLGFSPNGDTLLIGDDRAFFWKFVLSADSSFYYSLPKTGAQAGWAVPTPNGNRIISLIASSAQIYEMPGAKPLDMLIDSLADLTALDAAIIGSDTLLVTGNATGSAILWNIMTGDSLFTFSLPELPSAVSRVNISSDGQKVALGKANGKISVWETIDQREFLITLGDQPEEGRHREPVTSIDFSTATNEVITGSTDNTVIIWNLDDGKPLVVVADHRDDIVGAGFFPDNPDAFFSLSRNGRLIIWERFNCFFAVNDREIDLSTNGLTASIILSPNGQRFAVGYENGDVQLWDVTTAELLRHLGGHQAAISSLQFTGDGSGLLSGSTDGRILYWDLTIMQPTLTQTLETPNSVSIVDFAADGNKVLTAGADRRVRQWSLDGVELNSTVQFTQSIQDAAWSPTVLDDRVLISDGRVVMVWDADQGALDRLPGFDYRINTLGFGVHSSRYWISGQDQIPAFCDSNCFRIERWDLNEIDKLDSFLHPVEIVALQVSPVDSNRFVTAGTDQVIRLWDRETKELLQSFYGHSGAISALAFSTDGAWIASGGEDGTVLLWDAGSGTLLYRFLLPDAVKAIAFRPPIGANLSIAAGHAVYTWNTMSGTLFSSLGHTQVINTAVFSPNGQRIITGGDDHKARIWQN